MPYALLAIETQTPLEERNDLPSVLRLWQQGQTGPHKIEMLTKGLFEIELPSGLKAFSDMTSRLDQSRIAWRVHFSTEKVLFTESNTK